MISFYNFGNSRVPDRVLSETRYQRLGTRFVTFIFTFIWMMSTQHNRFGYGNLRFNWVMSPTSNSEEIPDYVTKTFYRGVQERTILDELIERSRLRFESSEPETFFFFPSFFDGKIPPFYVIRYDREWYTLTLLLKEVCWYGSFTFKIISSTLLLSQENLLSRVSFFRPTRDLPARLVVATPTPHHDPGLTVVPSTSRGLHRVFAPTSPSVTSCFRHIVTRDLVNDRKGDTNFDVFCFRKIPSSPFSTLRSKKSKDRF